MTTTMLRRVVIAGLANPGTIAWAIGAAESTATLTALSRHSVGAAAVDALAELLLAGTPGTVDDGSSASTRDGASRALAPQWARDKKLKARVLQLHPSGSERGDGEGDDGVARVILTKPTVFMNESGKSVGRSMRAFDVDVGRLCLVHDELELPFGRVAIKRGGSHKGHNGLKSTIASVHSPDFWRVRIGIGRPESRASGVVSDYVLGNFEEDELAEMRSDVLPRAAHMMRDLVEELVHPDRPANHRQG